VRKERAERADTSGEGGCQPGPHPSNPLSAHPVAGTDIGTDHSNQRRAKSEDERDLQVFESYAHAIAGQCQGAKGADQAGEQDHIQIGQHSVERSWGTDTQNFPK
jgi:hypothetical protein